MTPAPAFLPDPVTFIATVSAALQAVQTWLAVRDYRAAAQAGDAGFRSGATDQQAAGELATLVPREVLADMTKRVKGCWEKYRSVLNDDQEYLPDEVDNATEAVKRCICRELRRIHSLNDTVPAGDLQNWWNAYCVAPAER